jgi:hypothetical protein
MVSASKPLSRRLSALPKAASAAATWIAHKLSAATVLGLVLALTLLERIPPFLAASSPAAPVEIVRTVPVPYLDPTDPARSPAPAPKRGAKGDEATILQVVARRARSRQQAEREGESGALGKAGADVAAGSTPAATSGPADAKPADPKAPDAKAGSAEAKPAAKAETPEPDQWSDAEIIAALRDCLRRLAPLGAEIEIAPPIRQERCGAPAPVVLKRIGTGASKVEFQPPVTLNCAMVASLHTWVERTLQPAAQEVLGSPVVRVRNASGYACRNRIGALLHADRLSEHAMANAVDISGFVTADGRTVEVLGQWGPTARDLREQQERAWQAAQEAKAAAKEAEGEAAQAARAASRAERGAKRDQATAEAARKKDAATRKRDEAQAKEAEWRNSLLRAAELQKLGRGEDAPRLQRTSDTKERRGDAAKPVALPAGKDEAAPTTPAETRFLRRLHRGACGTFGTVLGPDANEAHRNHFHFDLAARKSSAFCE